MKRHKLKSAISHFFILAISITACVAGKSISNDFQLPSTIVSSTMTAIQTDPPEVLPEGDMQPLNPAECEDLAFSMERTLELETSSEVVPVHTSWNGESGSACQVTVLGDGHEFDNIFEPSDALQNMMLTQDWVGGDLVKVISLNASSGNVYGQQLEDRPVMNISKENEISFFWRNIQNENLWNAVSGDRFILENGVYNSAISDTASEPRTVAGKTAAGHLVLMVADGRRQGITEGLTFPQVAAVMQEFGVIIAINLDGGGSSTLYADQKVQNVPVEDDVPGKERAVANHLGIRLKGDDPDFQGGIDLNQVNNTPQEILNSTNTGTGDPVFPSDETVHLFEGAVLYKIRRFKANCFILVLDLSMTAFEIIVTPPDRGEIHNSRTVSEFTDQFNVRIAVNADGFNRIDDILTPCLGQGSADPGTVQSCYVNKTKLCEATVTLEPTDIKLCEAIDDPIGACFDILEPDQKLYTIQLTCAQGKTPVPLP